MVAAKPNPWMLWWFDRWCHRAIRRQFFRLHRYGDPDWLNRFDNSRPRLYLANHPSFWDGIVLHHVLRTHLRQPTYCMIDAEQIAEHPFFRRVGGFSVDRARPRDGMAAIRYAVDRLRDPAAVVIFPQGQIVGVDQRPLGFESGVARIIAGCPAAQVIPVALRYDFWAEQRGEALMHIGAPVDCTGLSRRQMIATLERAVTAGLDELTNASSRRVEGEVLLRGKRSISQWKRWREP